MASASGSEYISKTEILQGTGSAGSSTLGEEPETKITPIDLEPDFYDLPDFDADEDDAELQAFRRKYLKGRMRGRQQRR